MTCEDAVFVRSLRDRQVACSASDWLNIVVSDPSHSCDSPYSVSHLCAQNYSKATFIYIFLNLLTL